MTFGICFDVSIYPQGRKRGRNWIGQLIVERAVKANDCPRIGEQFILRLPSGESWDMRVRDVLRFLDHKSGVVVTDVLLSGLRLTLLPGEKISDFLGALARDLVDAGFQVDKR